MLCLVPSSASVKSPRIASSATLALKSALYRFLVVFIPSILQIGNSLTPRPVFRDHLTPLNQRARDFDADLLALLNVLQENTGVTGVFASDATREDFIGMVALD